MLGSLIVKYNQVFWSKYLLVFLVSGLCRFAVSFFLVAKLREVRPVEQIPYPTLLFKVMAVAPTQGIMHEIGVVNEELISIPRKIRTLNKTVLQGKIKQLDETLNPFHNGFKPRKRRNS
jgi:hypothetical protein